MRTSVCIATFNGEKYINEQIDSILTQLIEGDEIIVSDDHSTDNTIDILEKYDDNRIKIFYNDDKKGYTSNFENAISNATGDIIVLSDQDDVWKENKIEKIKELIENNYDMIISDAYITDEKLNIINNSYFNFRKMKHGFFYNLVRTGYLGCCIAFNRNVLNMVLPFPTNHINSPHDLWIGLVGYRYFKVMTLNEPLIYYRRHSMNVSSGGTNAKTSVFFKMKYRIYVLLKIEVLRLNKRRRIL